MSTHTLRLVTDRFAAGASFALPPLRRAAYVFAGSAIVRAGGQSASLERNGVWCGNAAPTVIAGRSGATVLRFELATGARSSAADGADSTVGIEAPITLPAGELLLRCDRVDFPPGGEALTHVHQGPGIRYLIAGSIRIDSGGQSHHYGVGEAWFESGPEPVYAAASATEPTAFVRVMILPRALLGKSSIRYVRPEDADRPKSQKYQVFADEPIDS
jgi:quercetin dioxygenase-like cupin family protein